MKRTLFTPSLFLFLAFSAASLHAGVDGWFITKSRIFSQAADDTQPTTLSGAAITVGIELTSIPADAISATLTRNSDGFVYNLTENDGELLYEDDFLTIAALETAFPPGGYTLTLVGGTLGGGAPQNITLTASTYPAVPYLSGSQFTDLQSANATEDLTLNWLPSNATPDLDYLELELELNGDSVFAAEYESDFPNSQVIPADTLASDVSYFGYISTYKGYGVSGAGAFAAGGYVDFESATTFAIDTVTPVALPSGVVSWDISKGKAYRQTANDNVPATPFEYAVEISVETQHAGDATGATLTGGGISGSIALEFNAEDTEWLLEKEYATDAAMNLEFPGDGSYTITFSGGDLDGVSQAFTLTGDDYASLASLTGTSFERLQAIDAGKPFAVTWTDVSSSTPDFLALELENNSGESEDFSFASGGIPTGLSFPADTLVAGHSYEGWLTTTNLATLSGSGGFGVDGEFTSDIGLNLTAQAVLARKVAPIVGAWQFGGGAANESGVVVFQADGTYYHIEDSAGTAEDGFERGTYSWNEQSSHLTVTTINDTNGTTGLSDTIGQPMIVVNGETLTFTDDEGDFNLTRVTANASAIVGAWRICDNSSNDLGVVVFLDNGSYFHGEFDRDGTDQTGMERGSYSWNSATQELSLISVDVDTNLGLGLSDFPLSTEDAVPLHIIGMRGMYVFDEAFDETTALHRVSNATIQSEWRISKSRDFTQIADDQGPLLPTEISWEFYADLNTLNASDAGAISLQHSSAPTPTDFVQEDPGDWSYDDGGFASQGLLDTAYPDGNYTITVSGGEFGTVSQEISIDSTSYPDMPYLTGTSFTDVQDVTPIQSFNLTWNDPSDADIELIISSEIDDQGEDFFEQYSFNPNTSVVVPVGALPAGITAYGYLGFSKNAGDSTGDGFGVSGAAVATSAIYNFVITTQSATVVTETAIASAGLFDEDAGLLSSPHDDGVPNLLKFAFNMDLTASDTSTLEQGGVSGLPTSGIDESGAEPVFIVAFVRRKGSGLVYTAQHSADLQPNGFQDMVGSVDVLPVQGNENFERVTVSQPCDPAVVRRCFGRVEVSLPADE